MSAKDVMKKMMVASKITIHWVGASKVMGRGIRETMASAVEAEESSITASKRLYNSRIECIREINALKSKIREFWLEMSLPYVEPGIRLIKADEVEEFNHRMGVWAGLLKTAAERVQEMREVIIQDAKERLGKAFDPSNYPQDLSASFGLEWCLPEIAPPEYLAIKHPEIHQQEKEKFEAKMQEAVELAEEMFLAELKELVERLKGKLVPDADGREKKFHQTTITGFQEFFEKFQNLYIGDGEELENLVAQTKEVLAGVDAKDLKKSKVMQEDVLKGLKEVELNLTTLVVKKPRRALKLKTKDAKDQLQGCVA